MQNQRNTSLGENEGGVCIRFPPPPPEVSDVVAGSAHLVHAPAGVRGAGVVPRASEMSDHTLNCQYFNADK